MIYPKYTNRTNPKLTHCNLCKKDFKNGEKIFLKKSGNCNRYHIKCAIKVNLWDDDK